MAETRSITCQCGKVEVEVTGPTLVSAICHCDDCQAGSRRLEALPGSPRVMDDWSGTPYVHYRKDRIQVTRGSDLIERIKLKPGSPTNRAFAGCCNTPLFIDFDRGPFWVAVYHGRLGSPPPEMRVFTKFRPAGTSLPTTPPSYDTFPLSLVFRIAAARIAMLVGR